MKENKYERIEITFSKENEEEMKLYNYVLKEGKFLGKSKYIKKILYEKMLEDKSS